MFSLWQGKIINKYFTLQIVALPPKQQEAVRHCFRAAQRKSVKGISYSANWLLECIILRMKSRSLYEHMRHHQILLLPSRSVAASGHLQGFVDLDKFTPPELRAVPADHGLLLVFQPFMGELAHIKPNSFEKMRVNLAFQLFTTDVLRGLLVFQTAIEEQHGDSTATAHFVELIRDLIAAMSSRTPPLSSQSRSLGSVRFRGRDPAILPHTASPVPARYACQHCRPAPAATAAAIG